MKILRSAIVVAGAASSILMATTPASAATAAAFDGSASIGCFGCGVYGPEGNGADFSVAGVVNNDAGSGSGYATFTVNEPGGVGCVISGSASGDIHVDFDGAVNGSVSLDGSFSWGRAGNVAVITVNGDVNGVAVAAFVVTDPVGNPCHQAVTAHFSGVLAG